MTAVAAIGIAACATLALLPVGEVSSWLSGRIVTLLQAGGLWLRCRAAPEIATWVPWLFAALGVLVALAVVERVASGLTSPRTVRPRRS